MDQPESDVVFVAVAAILGSHSRIRAICDWVFVRVRETEKERGMLVEIVATVLILVALIWFLGAPPSPGIFYLKLFLGNHFSHFLLIISGPTQRSHPGELWTIFLMRLMRLVGFPKPLSSPAEVFAEVERQTNGLPWKYEDEKQFFEKPLQLFGHIIRDSSTLTSGFIGFVN